MASDAIEGEIEAEVIGGAAIVGFVEASVKRLGCLGAIGGGLGCCR